MTVSIDKAAGVIEALPFKVLRHQLTGSAWFFGEGNDVDILIEVADINDAAFELDDRGWSVADGYESLKVNGWFAARRGDINLLVCSDDGEHYVNMVGGAWVCKALALAGILRADDKDTRITIHRALTGEKIDFGLCTMEHGVVTPR